MGRFVLVEELGRGAQATVWRAHDPRLDRDVALKLIDARADSAAVALWLHEARAVGRLSHPNIVPVFEADDAGGQPYLVFELVRGRTLADQLRRAGAMPQQSALKVLDAVLDALAAAHAEGIVHRDLKPSNILVDLAGRPRVMDFGIAARVVDAADGRVVGTPGYISPEAAAGAPPHPAMDVFSVGMVLAHMLLGQPLIRERDPMVALRRAMSEDFALPDEAPGDDALRALVRRALARDPAQRFANAQDFREAIRNCTPAQVPGPIVDGTKSTLDFLLRRMRHRTDFPALSHAVLRIQRIVASDKESLGSLANEILKDVALTNKLLRMVNTAHFRQAGSGGISTVSRAVALVGFAGIRNMALSLVLLEHMQDKSHAGRLREEFAASLLAGQLASELTPLASDVEEAHLAALFQNLGRLLTEFYLPEEAQAIRDVLDGSDSRPRTPLAIELAAERVLGLSFEALGSGVAVSWGLPETLQKAMRRPQGDPPGRAAARGVDRHRWLAALANDVADAVRRLEPEQAREAVGLLAENYSKVLDLHAHSIRSAVESARLKLSEVAPAMGLTAASGTPTKRLISPESAPDPAPVDSLSPLSVDVVIDATMTLSSGAQETPSGRVDEALPQRVPAATMLAAGIQDVTDTLAAESFRLNEVLRMILETMFRALGFRRVVLCLRDPKSARMLGRFGLGEDIDTVARRFDFALDVRAGGAIDIFTAVCQKSVDTLISDASQDRIQSRLPAWYRAEVAAPTFLLLPMVMKGSTFGLIYADAASRGGITLDEREMSLVRTLRNQAVMAFRQST